MVKVTVWERYIKGSWEHNHIEEGWNHDIEPVPAVEHQRRSWENGIWRKYNSFLKNGRVGDRNIT